MSNVINTLNQIQADSYVMFLKLHNFHWNVKGMLFHTIHNYTEEAYDEMGEIFDEMAERALQLGGETLILNSKLIEKSKIKEETKTSFDAKYVLENLKQDYEYFLKTFKKLSEESGNDTATAAIADDNIGKIEKRLWMLESTLAK